MKKLLVILVLGMTMFSCSSDDDGNSYPSLRVVNDICDGANKDIDYVELLNYGFGSINIASGEEQTFALDDGMPGGLDDIRVTVNFSGPQISYRYIDVDFVNGETITITATGGCGGEGSEPIELN